MLNPAQSNRRWASGAGRGRGWHARRVALLVPAAALLIPAVVVLLAGHTATARPLQRRGSGLDSPAADSRGSADSARESTPADPLTSVAMRRYLATRSGGVSIAVEDLDDPVNASGRPDGDREWLLHPGARDQTASIIKVDVLETLLHQSRGVLSYSVRDAAEDMIDDSDNDDATDLWDADGGASGVASYNRLAGLTQTSPNAVGYWGETLTSAADQIKLLRQLLFPSRLLTAGSRRYALRLMEDIDAGQDWGVTGGVPDRATVALKNGWVPLTSEDSWEINSIGWVHGEGRDYLIAVLTAHDPGEQYGIDTIDHISSLVFGGLRPSGRDQSR